LESAQMKARTMKATRFKIALLAVLASAVPALALELGSSSVRNCAWCHGSGAQGYFPAPRLAGQRAPYIQTQLMDFRAHTRDNPFSQQYMWGAVAGLDSRTARDLAIYFSTIPPKPANDGPPQFAGLGETIYQQGMPDANIVACVVCHGPRGRHNSSVGRTRLHLFEKTPRAMGRGLSRNRKGADAPHCREIVGAPNRCACLLSQLSAVNAPRSRAH
jgi:cytochrome c553